MGIIIRQSLKNSLVTYVGLFIGVISSIFIYPLDLETYGYLQFLNTSGIFLVHFASLGSLSLVIKFFPEFKDYNNGHNGFMSLSLFILTGALLVFSLFFFLNKVFMVHSMEALRLGNANLDQNLDYIFILTILQSFITFFTFYTSNFNRIVIPNLITNFLFKIFLPVLVLLYYFNHVLKEHLPYYLIAFSAVALIGLIVYTGILGQLSFRIQVSGIKKEMVKRMSGYWLFGLLQNVGSMLAFRIDVIMVAMMLGYSYTGVYSILLVLATMIEIPNKSVIQIASPIISEAWAKDQLDKIEDIYKKSSLNLIIIGLFLFGGAWLLLDDIFIISTNTNALAEAKYVFLFLALAKLIDLATSINTQIIIYSKYFRYNLFFVVILGLLNVLLNYFFIDQYGIMGAALATCISILIYNIFKLFFILINTGMQPFTWLSIKVLLLFGISYTLVYLIPSTQIPLLNILIKGSFFSMIYLSGILFFRISDDIQQLVFTFVDRFKKK